MQLFYDEGHAAHQGLGEMKDGKFVPCAERTERLDLVLHAVKNAGLNWHTPDPIDPLPFFEKVHAPDYLHFLRTVHADWLAAERTGDVLPLVWPGPGFRTDLTAEDLGLDGRIGLYCFDGGSPITAGTWDAMLAGGRAILAVVASDADIAVSLTRPPGHHAMPHQYGGYCYVNFAAVAAQAARLWGAERVAILDVDYHHGNGTQAIFYERADVLVVNLHSDPKDEYPYYLGHADETGIGPGDECNLNIPLPKGTKWDVYGPALDGAIDRIRHYGPDVLLISFGADGFKDDPLGRFGLTQADFIRMGSAISRLRLPTKVVLEGGYAIDALGNNVMAFLGGLND